MDEGAQESARRLERLTAYVQELFEENDRAVVVVGGSILDELLVELLGKVLRPSSSKQDALLGLDRPLGSFSARIEIAWRLGLLDEHTVRGLTIVRRIRNGMAHTVPARSLAVGRERDQTRDLFRVVCGRVKASTRFWNRNIPARVRIRSTSAKQFRLALAILIVGLEDAVALARPIDLGHPLWKIPERRYPARPGVKR